MQVHLRMCYRRNSTLCHNAGSTLTCACRLAHAGRRPDARAPLSAQALKLRRALWMRMHPVERWTSLVDLGRRGAYLIEKTPASPVADAATTPSFSFSSGSSAPLGSSDDKVHFSDAATAAHRQLCAALPYPARLHLCLSLLMWVRCLRDVQDTLARLRLPYAVVRRPQRYAVADVYPTRLSECWVDVHTTVSTKMNPRRNSTAEQVPAPHTWDVETAETMEDAATESTVTLDAGRVLHGRPRQLRLSGRALLRRVQGVQPRASVDDDDVVTRRTEGGSEGGWQRRRRRRLLQSDAAATLAGPSSLSTEAAAAATDVLNARRGPSLEFQPDAARCVAPVSLEAQPVEDALYHGNERRGEGCPMSDDGESTPNPIYIHVPPFEPEGNGGAEAEALLRHCVMAHAAVLSSLYIEGRVVDFSTNHTVVAAYVQLLWEDLISDQYLRVSLIGAEAAAAVTSHRPYYPAWCWRSVLVLLPPKKSGLFTVRDRRAAGYSAVLLRDWAARIAQAAPCAVIVDGSEAAAAAYVQQLKDEVEWIQRSTNPINASDGPASPLPSSSKPSVEWVPITTRDTVTGALHPNSESHSATAPVAFQPRRAAASKQSLFSVAVAAALHVLRRQPRAETDDGAAVTTARHAARQQRFLQDVEETLRDRFYMCEFLYSPTQSCLPPYRFERWVWEQLPDNVRVVGINTAPLDVLYYFPQGVFLTHKVGNAFRYRAVERTVVAKDVVPSWSSHPLRHVATQLKRLRRRRWRRHGGNVADGLHAELALLDRREVRRCAAAQRSEAKAAPPSKSGASSHGSAVKTDQGSEDAGEDGAEVATHALVRERTVEYLAEPSKWTLLALATARFFRL
ncbi:putative mitochondrial hypothetical protein [Leptomonas pyrrhocoris]|uniref:Uncharacterized protein n=1 Tax=Leptomonas pyrrhocoris TaxID=157538 RepID=A0A0M9FVH3_LEPPY|nr:putative mitochondrial hypothetical protein [Leptomonas pyrrhocoris]KPA76726.1 putative mitochondrial hypothetical protein [Leptomonas pyrrhocoris]|eukprot:XP_015655165.1 putative mitochondrial hypothetical protein [Leptomonas pyrrhocoris]